MDFMPRQIVLSRREVRASGLPLIFDRKEAWSRAFQLLDEIEYMDLMADKAERVNVDGRNQDLVNETSERLHTLLHMSALLNREVLEGIKPPVLDEDAFAAYMKEYRKS